MKTCLFVPIMASTNVVCGAPIWLDSPPAEAFPDVSPDASPEASPEAFFDQSIIVLNNNWVPDRSTSYDESNIPDMEDDDLTDLETYAYRRGTLLDTPHSYNPTDTQLGLICFRGNKIVPCP